MDEIIKRRKKGGGGGEEKEKEIKKTQREWEKEKREREKKTFRLSDKILVWQKNTREKRTLARTNLLGKRFFPNSDTESRAEREREGTVGEFPVMEKNFI